MRSALRPLAAPRFRMVFFGRLVSFLGNAMAPVALAFAVLGLTGSASDLGVVLAARSLPTVALLLLGGVWADRLPRHVILVVFSLVAAGTQSVAAVLLISGSARVWQLALLEAANGMAAAFLGPASLGVAPQTVEPSLIQPANALLRLAMNAAKVIGAGLAGVVVAAYGPGWAIAVDAATFVVAAVFFGRLALPRIALPRAGVLGELRSGWREFRSRTWLWTIVAQFAFVNAAFSGGFNVLGPLVAKRDLGGATAWGLVVAFEAAGFIAGGLSALWHRPRRPLLLATYGVLAGSSVLFALAVAAPVPVMLAAAFAAGAGFEIFGVQWDTVVQHNVPPEALSRVYAYDALGSLVFNPLGQTLAGPAMAALGLGGAIALSGAVILTATLAVLTVRDVRTLTGHATA
ncbi:MFS transporter [Actinoallomurus sp. NBC_01490]|uniref:MFS transporter n=1 Tax=Actinoallomurus sp. NBC_01490 TaxID=2903557 RepID=UPI002E3728A7|nr:MFS transporter [Actinoallomurus sp. NBC_01490]